MLAKKYTVTALVIILLGLIGFTIYHTEKTKPSEAALSPVNTDGKVTAAPTQTPGKDSSAEKEQADTKASQQDNSNASPQAANSASDDKPAIGTEPATKPVTEGSKPNKETSPVESTPTVTQNTPDSVTDAPASTAAPVTGTTQGAVASDTGNEVQQTSPAESTPSLGKTLNTSTSNQNGEDPVPDAKKVTISAAEIANVVEQFDQIASSDQTDPAWKRKADNLIVKGLDFLGTPYVFGAKTGQTDSFDCSSFLKYIFASQGVTLPRDSRQQSQRGTSVSIDELREGDLVFFTTPQRKNNSGIDRIGHVGVYLGNGLVLHTFRPGIGVTVSELSGSWKERFVEAKRVLS